MKKIILTTLIAVLAMVSVNAQATFGIKAGVNFASILNENISGVKGRTSFNAGIVAEIETSSSTAFQAEIVYSGQGFSYKGGNIPGVGEALKDTYKLNYLNIPMVFKYYVNDEFSIGVGPQVGFLLSAKTDVGDIKVDDYFTAASFDILFDLAYKFDNGFNLSARYNLGLTDIWKGPTVNPPYYYYNYGKANGVVQLGVGFFFN